MLLLLLACTDPATLDTAVEEPLPGLRDAEGRLVLHRGVNLNNAAKGEGYHHGLSEASLALMPEHGVTLVRLLVFWEALEPEPGAYDGAYVDQVRQDLEALDALGLDVVLDLHQDVYGEGFGATGFPAWTCDAAHYEAFEHPGGSWYMAYADDNVIACFDAFWASRTLQEAYAAMAAHLVAETVDLPALVGLDVINEPYWGSVPVDEHDLVVLPTFYGRVVGAVREVSEDLRLWLAPSVASNLTTRPVLDLSGFEDQHLGVSPHFYPLYAEEGTGYDGDFVDEAAALGRLADHADEQGVPLWLGEYGIFSDEGDEEDYVASVLQTLEARGASTAYWSYDRGGLLDSEGGPTDRLAALAGPWAHRIPGVLEGRDADGTVHFVFEGQGEMIWVAPVAEPACTATGAELGTPRWEGGRLVLPLTAQGAASVRCY